MKTSILASTSFLLFSVTVALVYNSLPSESGIRVEGLDHHDTNSSMPIHSEPIRAQLGQVVSVLK